MARPTPPPSWAPVPDDLRSMVAAICARLPEAELADNGTGYVVRFRRRSIGTLLSVAAPDGGVDRTILVVLADPEELPALHAMGHPYFPVPNASPRIGIVLDERTDRAEVAELVTDAYRRVAPKRLTAGLGDER